MIDTITTGFRRPGIYGRIEIIAIASFGDALIISITIRVRDVGAFQIGSIAILIDAIIADIFSTGVDGRIAIIAIILIFRIPISIIIYLARWEAVTPFTVLIDAIAAGIGRTGYRSG